MPSNLLANSLTRGETWKQQYPFKTLPFALRPFIGLGPAIDLSSRFEWSSASPRSSSLTTVCRTLVLAKVPETAKHCKVIDLEQHDVGVGVGRNTAIDAAETEFIFLLDDDQIVTPDLHLDRVYQRFMDYDLDILAVRQGDGGRPMLFSPLMNGTRSGCIEANANASAKPVGATWSATHF